MADVDEKVVRTVLTIERIETPLIGPVDLVLKSRECTSISGPSGAGKSLLLRAIVDLDKNTGEVVLNGVPRGSYSAPDWRKRVAYVPAESGWWSDLVKDHFTETDDLPGLLQAVGLEGALSWEVGRLSTGERQRLAIVRALQLDPEVLLLDEPTSALDPPSVERVETLLRERMGAGIALLLVTHDPDQPERLGARRYRMAAGRLSPVERSQAAQ